MVRNASRSRVLQQLDGRGLAAPLICTADDDLLDVLLDWCSALGSTPEVVRDAGMARQAWSSASLVLVGDDVAADLARSRPARRPAVFVVARSGSARPWDLAVALGAEDVLDPAERDPVLQTLTAAVDGGGDACVVAVVGAVGGAGASCLAAALAVEAGRRGLRVLLLDGDPLGGGLDVLLGIESADGLRWSDVGPHAGALTARTLTEALPRMGNVWVLAAGRGPMRDEPRVDGILRAARRGFDLVVGDVNRQVGGVGSDVLAESVLTVVVVPEDVRSVAAAARVIDRLRPGSSSLAVVTARRPAGLSREAVSASLGVPVISRIGRDRRLPESIDHGAGLGGSAALRRAVRPLLDLVAAG
ncbi:MAG: septum site-determining protein Ssd [Aeromicrobium sp.]